MNAAEYETWEQTKTRFMQEMGLRSEAEYHGFCRAFLNLRYAMNETNPGTFQATIRSFWGMDWEIKATEK